MGYEQKEENTATFQHTCAKTLTQPSSHRHTQFCPLVTMQLPSNKLRLAQAMVVVEGWRINKEGGISWGSSWMPAGPQNCWIIGMQRWMWQKLQMYRGWQNRGGFLFYTASELVAWLWCREKTRLCVLEVNLASFFSLHCSTFSRVGCYTEGQGWVVATAISHTQEKE